MKFSEILSKNLILKDAVADGARVDLVLLSNITINQLSPILEYELRSSGLNVCVQVSDYDNILQSSEKITTEIPFVFWELANIKDSFVYEIELYSEEELKVFTSKIIDELKLLFKNLQSCKQVFFNKFSHIVFSNELLYQSNFEIFVNEVNMFVNENLPDNFYLIHIDKVIAKLGIGNVCNLRNFYAAKSLYTVEFFKKYCSYISPAVLSIYGKSKKALILDCDNTLWNGIIGEDGLTGIEFSGSTKKGIFFKEVQTLAKSLLKRGIVLGICSKNNEKDVQEVFEGKNERVLEYSDFVVKKINWENKYVNVALISKELNIGLDSLVFLDDSSFEIELMKNELSEVFAIQVPKDLSSYPLKMLELTNVFFSLSKSSEDMRRSKMYLEDSVRKGASNDFENIEDYLASLNIQVEFANKDSKFVERIAQLTCKTNQFNLTTKRYSMSDISKFFSSSNHDVITIEVSDKFGSSGLTGVSIIEYFEEYALIDTFLMSCRILGRNIEKLFIYEVLAHIVRKGKAYVLANYSQSPKNMQTEFFYEENLFVLMGTDGISKSYKLRLSDSLDRLTKPDYISTTWKKE